MLELKSKQKAVPALPVRQMTREIVTLQYDLSQLTAGGRDISESQSLLVVFLAMHVKPLDYPMT